VVIGLAASAVEPKPLAARRRIAASQIVISQQRDANIEVDGRQHVLLDLRFRPREIAHTSQFCAAHVVASQGKPSGRSAATKYRCAAVGLLLSRGHMIDVGSSGRALGTCAKRERPQILQQACTMCRPPFASFSLVRACLSLNGEKLLDLGER